jgi:hypothetical protein
MKFQATQSLLLSCALLTPGYSAPQKAAISVTAARPKKLVSFVAKDMGADIVVGIHLETAPVSPTEAFSSFAVLGRSISVMIAANELRSMEQADLLVTVPLQKCSAQDYSASEAIIKAGYDAAAAKAKVLSTFSVSEGEWQAYLANRKARQKTAPVPEFVQVTGTRPELADSIEKRMSVEIGKPVDTARLDRQVMTLSGQGRFSNVTKGYNANPAAPGPFPLSEILSQSFFHLNESSSVLFGASGGTSYSYKTGIPAFSLGGSQRLVAWARTNCSQINISWDKLDISDSWPPFLHCWAAQSISSDCTSWARPTSCHRVQAHPISRWMVQPGLS